MCNQLTTSIWKIDMDATRSSTTSKVSKAFETRISGVYTVKGNHVFKKRDGSIYIQALVGSVLVGKELIENFSIPIFCTIGTSSLFIVK